jgi:hypothetical protein
MERKIKNIGFKVNQNEIFLNPNTLESHKNEDDEPMCPSKYYISHNNILNFVKKKCYNNISKEDSQKYMLYPYTVLSSTELHKIYNFIDYDNFYDKIQELVNNGQKFKTIDRIINSCIKTDYEYLKNKNKLLTKVYIYLINKFYPKNKLNDNDINKIIQKWFNNYNFNNFNLNLGDEIIKKI